MKHPDDEVESAPACARVRGRLPELLDGGLPALDAARDEGHLEVCGACSKERAQWELVFADARTALRPALSELPDLELATELVLARIEPREGRRARAPLRVLRSPMLRAALTAAAGILLLLALDRAGWLAPLQREAQRAGAAFEALERVKPPLHPTLPRSLPSTLSPTD